MYYKNNQGMVEGVDDWGEGGGVGGGGGGTTRCMRKGASGSARGRAGHDAYSQRKNCHGHQLHKVFDGNYLGITRAMLRNKKVNSQNNSYNVNQDATNHDSARQHMAARPCKTLQRPVRSERAATSETFADVTSPTEAAMA